MVLAAVLQQWQLKAPISYELVAVHISMQFAESNSPPPHLDLMQSQLSKLGVKLAIHYEHLTDRPSCYACAAKRRQILFRLADEYNCQKIAFGHHRDDLIETVLLNLFYSGNISTMRPKQELFAGRLSLIRPLALLAKDDIYSLAECAGVQAVDNQCPLAENSRREWVRRLIAQLETQIPDVKSSIFAACANVRQDYLL
jgi:tRNA 2-thiocytidine biosynthesis protein TtcA